MARTKRATWPWHGLTGLILLLIGLAIWYSTSLISYEWRWNRVPQYFAYQAEEPLRADSISRVEKIEPQGSDARVTLVDEDGKQQVLTVAADSLQFSENDDVAEGDVVGATRHWAAGPLAWGLWTTLWISFVSGAFGLFIGLFTGLCRLSKNPTLHDLSTLYVELVRGTPLLVQIFIFYFFIGTVLNLSREFAGVAALALFTGAYVAEIVRAGVQSIARGQDEAARSLGLNAAQSMRHVILPQAFKRVLPPLAGQFISLVKDTSLVSVIAITELTKSGREAITTSFSTFEIWFCVAALYLVINLPLSHLAGRLERRLGQSD
ncbi:amino acid ABC transporter permease [Pseudomonas sp. GD04087]|uniref:Putative glutamine transport system permease protein GlnP n=1 Tax=Pseudomonas multiresinivorans TaxID=95301 RepID=A0A7Z3BIE8_9PSED|nr:MULTISPECIES: amino acid ABC transporter permease [Pseudomonas]MCE4068912.1 amino acid ABC transporter permease [Pseudomonas nitritireducens]MCE4078101.1 amino acid ABC transporter permease [Pseudomonas nitroreducens]MCP1650528.1 polar amino acid transport system permease protein [Pseudomonas nitroreducens]MCP1688480.1 polar amino acid transport system permease protein [Pseudomonas nitroreducens]MDH0293060.1 amino acid ABC transporter permease [Pseudomonas sp. GD04087]